MKFFLGTKQAMTQVFDADGRVHPATILTAEPLTVTQVKTVETDGYNAVQVGFGVQKEHRVKKAQQGHFKKAGEALFKGTLEFRTSEAPEQKVGDVLNITDVFAEGDAIEVSGISKGKGFQGVVKRHGFHGGPRSHGQKHNERTGGSIGGGGRAGGRVVKGMKMPGRMGSDRTTVKGLTVLKVDAENNQLIVSGAVPGRRGTLIEVVSK